MPFTMLTLGTASVKNFFRTSQENVQIPFGRAGLHLAITGPLGSGSSIFQELLVAQAAAISPIIFCQESLLDSGQTIRVLAKKDGAVFEANIEPEALAEIPLAASTETPSVLVVESPQAIAYLAKNVGLLGQLKAKGVSCWICSQQPLPSQLVANLDAQLFTGKFNHKPLELGTCMLVQGSKTQLVTAPPSKS